MKKQDLTRKKKIFFWQSLQFLVPYRSYNAAQLVSRMKNLDLRRREVAFKDPLESRRGTLTDPLCWFGLCHNRIHACWRIKEREIHRREEDKSLSVKNDFLLLFLDEEEEGGRGGEG